MKNLKMGTKKGKTAVLTLYIIIKFCNYSFSLRLDNDLEYKSQGYCKLRNLGDVCSGLAVYLPSPWQEKMAIDINTQFFSKNHESAKNKGKGNYARVRDGDILYDAILDNDKINIVDFNSVNMNEKKVSNDEKLSFLILNNNKDPRFMLEISRTLIGFTNVLLLQQTAGKSSHDGAAIKKHIDVQSSADISDHKDNAKKVFLEASTHINIPLNVTIPYGSKVKVKLGLSKLKMFAEVELDTVPKSGETTVQVLRAVLAVNSVGHEDCTVVAECCGYNLPTSEFMLDTEYIGQVISGSAESEFS